MGGEQVDIGGGDDDAFVAGQRPEVPAAPIWNLSSAQTILAMGKETSEGQLSRKEKRKRLKKLRRKQLRQQAAEAHKLKENALLDDTAEQLRIQLEEQIEAELLAEEKAKHDEQERLWLEREKKAMEDFQRQQEELRKLEEERKLQGAEDNSEYVDDDGPAEIVWMGNEIIVRKRRVKLLAEPPASSASEDASKSISNPLPPQSAAFAAHHKYPRTPDASEQTPMFGTEQDKTHCPFHIKTGVCRFGVRCSRVHVYPDHSFTLLVRNMYTGLGLTWENDEGLESNKLLQEDGNHFGGWMKGNEQPRFDEEVAQHYEEFYEDVHSEFLQFGELVNFKVCKNGSSHLRGNVYVHYKTEAGAQAAYSAMNGRFYAAKQITCEFVGVTRWRVALCGEYMKGHHRPCSHGTACNFLHCFRNPHGEYDWADWDSAPPRYWAAKMAKLFGYEKDLDQGDDEFNDDRRQPFGSSDSPRQRESQQRSRAQHRHDFEHVARHRGSRRHKDSGNNYCSDSDDPGRSSRHRIRDPSHLSSSKEMDERTRRCHSSGDEDVAEDHHALTYDKIQKQQKSHNTGSHTEGEFADESIFGPRTKHRNGSRKHSPQYMEIDSKHRIQRHRSRDLKDPDNQQSLDLRTSRDRHKKASIETEGHADQIGSEIEYEARKKKFYSKKGAVKSLVHRRTGNHTRGRSFGDSSSSDSDVNKSHKSYRGYHDQGTRSTRRKSSHHENVNERNFGDSSSSDSDVNKSHKRYRGYHNQGTRSTRRKSNHHENVIDRSFGDSSSSDSDVNKSHKRYRGYHDQGTRSTRRKSSNHENVNDNENKSPDIHDRWTGNRDL